jgi:CBS domain-containing protein
MDENSYPKIEKFRQDHINDSSSDHFKLNQLHDEIMKQVVELSVRLVTNQYGPPPSPFSFFVMGSAGRNEQSVWSDQDHGIIYHLQSDEVKSYFLALGKEISKGLFQAGYPYCDGGVMASNPFWCKSITEWQQQLTKWILESSWESIRYLLIFLDGRSVYGEREYINLLKKHIFQTTNKEQLLTKSVSNTLHIKKGVNLLGKLLVETHGPHAGALNIKEIGLFPYVNAIRLLSIKEKLVETSTLLRLEKISDRCFPLDGKEFYQQQFLKLLQYRLLWGDHTNYDSGHYLSIQKLTREQTKEMKEIIKNGAALFHHVRKLLEKDDIDEDE